MSEGISYKQILNEDDKFHRISNKKEKTVKDLKQMIKEPASKEWFKKHGMPKRVFASKMASSGELKKAERGEKQHTGKRFWQEVDRDISRKKAGGEHADNPIAEYNRRYEKTNYPNVPDRKGAKVIPNQHQINAHKALGYSYDEKTHKFSR